jgi:hypothetical protein
MRIYEFLMGQFRKPACVYNPNLRIQSEYNEQFNEFSHLKTINNK